MTSKKRCRQNYGIEAFFRDRMQLGKTEHFVPIHSTIPLK